MTVATKEIVQRKHRDFEVGDRIVLVNPITNGLINLKPFQAGRIIYAQNKVEANIWFHVGTYYQDSINRALELDCTIGMSGHFEGVVLKVKSNDFAIIHNYSKHGEITIDEEKALSIPFFKYDEEHRLPTNSWRNNGKGDMVQNHVYKLSRIVDVVEDSFYDWVHKNCKFRKMRKSEREDGNYPEGTLTLRDESLSLYEQKRREVELAFMKATGIYKEFLGGLVFD